jgi:RNA polymerase sigma factor (sigma-70 family)
MQPADLAEAVLTIARTRDRTAFACVFNHFAPRVKAYLLRLGASSGEAEDLTQDVLLTVWRRAETYDPAQAGVGTWVFTIARNRRIDALRRGKRPDFDPDDPALQPEPPPAPDQVAAAGEWEERLATALEELPPEQGKLVRLAFYEDCSHSDIAQRLNLPLGTVKSRLRLAVARLRSRFEDR